jgi:hypothetical protein
VLEVDWLQTHRTGIVHRMRFPVLEGATAGPAILSAAEVARRFPCGAFVPVQQVCPAANIVVKSDAQGGCFFVLHRDPVMTAYTGLDLRVA